MASSPAFQFYVSDWAHSVQSMTLEERGAHITFLAWSWEHGPLPTDMKRLAAILGTGLSVARRLCAEVLKRWRQMTDGWVHPRLEKTRTTQAKFLARQSAAGKASAEQRKLNQHINQLSNQISTVVEPTEPDWQPNAQPGVKSPISDLRSPDPPEATDQPQGGTRTRDDVAPVFSHRGARGARAGGVIGDHRKCHPAAADACARGTCVPGFLAREWIQQFSDYTEGEAHVTAVVRRVIARLPPDGPLGDDPLKFWRAEWAAEHGTNARAASAGSGAQVVNAMRDAVSQRLAVKALKP